jgi:hypothetical protein
MEAISEALSCAGCCFAEPESSPKVQSSIGDRLFLVAFVNWPLRGASRENLPELNAATSAWRAAMLSQSIKKAAATAQKVTNATETLRSRRASISPDLDFQRLYAPRIERQRTGGRSLGGIGCQCVCDLVGCRVPQLAVNLESKRAITTEVSETGAQLRLVSHVDPDPSCYYRR